MHALVYFLFPSLTCKFCEVMDQNFPPNSSTFKDVLCAQSWLLAIPRTLAHQDPLSTEFSRQEYWSGLPFPSPTFKDSAWQWQCLAWHSPSPPLHPPPLLHPGLEWRSWHSLLLFSCSVVSDSWWPHGLQPARLLCPQDFPGKNTGVGRHFLPQGIFPAQGSNLCLLPWQADSLPLCPWGRLSPASIRLWFLVRFWQREGQAGEGGGLLSFLCPFLGRSGSAGRIFLSQTTGSVFGSLLELTTFYPSHSWVLIVVLALLCGQRWLGHHGIASL